MDIEQYEAVRDLILDMLNDADQDTLLLKDVVAGLRTVSAATSSSKKRPAHY